VAWELDAVLYPLDTIVAPPVSTSGLRPIGASIVALAFARRHENEEMRTLARFVIRDAQAWLVQFRGKPARRRP
jgi:hypothetical protein